MKEDIKIFLTEDNEKFFGLGPLMLLKKINELGSLRKAALDMKMAYSKAFDIIKRAENVLGFKLTEKIIGGSNGGGSILTKEALEFIEKYERFANECKEKCSEIYNKYF